MEPSMVRPVLPTMGAIPKFLDMEHIASGFLHATGVRIQLRKDIGCKTDVSPGEFLHKECAARRADFPHSCRKHAAQIENRIRISGSAVSGRCPGGFTKVFGPVLQGDTCTAFLETECLHLASARYNGAKSDAEIAAETDPVPTVSHQKLGGIRVLINVIRGHVGQALHSLRSEEIQRWPDPVRSAYEQVVNDPASAVRTGRMARNLGVCEQHFCKLFRMYCGVTFSTFVRRTRVAMAAEMMQHSNKRITEIAFECGFGSLSSFNNAFNREKNVCPTKYRKSAAWKSRQSESR